MAVRKPLVSVNGRLKELPSGDSVAATWADLIGRPAFIGAGSTAALARAAINANMTEIVTANGTAWRHPDGLQICYHLLSMAAVTLGADGQVGISETWTYPAQFSAQPPYVDLQPTGAGSGFFNLRIVSNSNANSGAVYLINTSSSTQTSGTLVRCLAVGRY